MQAIRMKNQMEHQSLEGSRKEMATAILLEAM